MGGTLRVGVPRYILQDWIRVYVRALLLSSLFLAVLIVLVHLYLLPLALRHRPRPFISSSSFSLHFFLLAPLSSLLDFPWNSSPIACTLASRVELQQRDAPESQAILVHAPRSPLFPLRAPSCASPCSPLVLRPRSSPANSSGLAFRTKLRAPSDSTNRKPHCVP